MSSATSRIVFTAPTTGTYYIDAGAWQDNYVGDYQLNVTTYVAPSVWTYDQIADQASADIGAAHRTGSMSPRVVRSPSTLPL